jgi:hypothetical protein
VKCIGHDQRYDDIVEEEDDWYSFPVVKKWLVRAMGEKLEDFDGIGR